MGLRLVTADWCTEDTKISTMLRDTATGELTVGADNTLFPIRLSSFAIIPSGNFVYAVQWRGDGTQFIRGFSIDSSSGGVTQLTIPDVPFGPWGELFAHPILPVVYAFENRCCASARETKLHIYTANDEDGVISEMPDSPVVLSGIFWVSPSISSDGTLFYALSPYLNDHLAIYRLDERGVPQDEAIAVVPLHPFPRTYAYFVHPNGKLIYTWGFHPDNSVELHVYRFDPDTGTVSEQDLSSILSEVLLIFGFDMSGRHMYMRRSWPSSDDPFQMFSVDETTGNLTYVGPEPRRNRGE